MLSHMQSSIRRDAESIRMLFWESRSFPYPGYHMRFWSPFCRVKREQTMLGVYDERGRAGRHLA